MSSRKVLIVAGATGHDDAGGQGIVATLQRHDFDAPETAVTVADALTRMRGGGFQLAIVPVDVLDPAEFAAIERQLHLHPGTRIVATAAHPDPELILRTMRAGIDEFLVRPVATSDLTAALERVNRRPAAEVTQQGQVVAVHSAKGGMGTTTVAINLAYHFARANPALRVALVDLVPGQGDVRLTLDLQSQYDFDDLASRRERVDADVLFSLLTPLRGVWVLPGSERLERSEPGQANSAAMVIDQLRRHFDVTVLDCGDHIGEPALAAFDAADQIVVVTQLTVPPLRATQRTLQLLRRLGCRDETLQVVVNRHHSGDTVSESEAASALAHPICATLPNDYRLVGKALTRGSAVVELEPRSDLAQGFARLATRLAPTLAAPAAAPAPPARGSGFRRLVPFGK